MKEYAIATFAPGVDEIFISNRTLGTFPKFIVFLDLIETDNASSNKIEYKEWGLELAHNTSFDLKMKYEETQLFKVMLGQMSEYFKDLIKECEVGREFFVILSQCLNVCKRVSREPVR